LDVVHFITSFNSAFLPLGKALCLANATFSTKQRINGRQHQVIDGVTITVDCRKNIGVYSV